MKVLVAIDSFKGSASSQEMNDYLSTGLRKNNKNIEIIQYPVADGGEGTLEALCSNKHCRVHKTLIPDIYGKKTYANYGVFSHDTVILEVAQSSGIHFVSSVEDPMTASSYGLGILIKYIVAEHPTIRKFVIGLGGSGINDAGIGMMKALGVSFMDQNNQEIPLGIEGINDICHINSTGLSEDVLDKEFILLSDVTNTLYGPEGATYTFGKQKGIKNIEEVDQAIQFYSLALKEKYKKDYSAVPGTGAAGGIGISFLYFLNASFVSGADYILDFIGIEEAIPQVDLIITGEGKIDNQTGYGKLPIVVAKRGKHFNKPVIAIAGDASNVGENVYNQGIDLVYSICKGPISLEESINNTKERTIQVGEDIFRMVTIFNKN